MKNKYKLNNRKKILISSLLPKLTMIVIGLSIIKLYGFELFGQYIIALTTGFILIQIISDAISGYYATNENLDVKNIEIYNTIKSALKNALILLIPSIIIILVIIIDCEPFINNINIKNASYIYIIAGTLNVAIQIINNQLNINGYSKLILIISIISCILQIIFSIYGIILANIMWLAIGMAASLSITFILQIYFLYKNIYVKNTENNNNIENKNEKNLNNLLKLTISFLLGAPVHWVVLKILSSGNNGIEEVGIFSYAFYFYTVINLVPSIMQPYIINHLSTKKYDVSEIINNIKKINKIKIICISLILYIAYLFCTILILNKELSTKLIAIGLVSILSGFIGVIAILLMQYVISEKRYTNHLILNILSSVFYMVISYVMVTNMYGALGVFISLIIAQTMQIMLIKKHF
jgi:hypothetical protein